MDFKNIKTIDQLIKVADAEEGKGVSSDDNIELDPYISEEKMVSVLENPYGESMIKEKSNPQEVTHENKIKK